MRYCYWKVSVGVPAERHSKASKQARLVERKVCFISDGEWVAYLCPKADSLPLTEVRVFIDRGGVGGADMQKQYSHF